MYFFISTVFFRGQKSYWFGNSTEAVDMVDPEIAQVAQQVDQGEFFEKKTVGSKPGIVIRDLTKVLLTSLAPFSLAREPDCLSKFAFSS